jgi:hypothetical protein
MVLDQDKRPVEESREEGSEPLESLKGLEYKQLPAEVGTSSRLVAAETPKCVHF